MVNRVLRDDPSKGDMHNRQGLSWSMFKECLLDYHCWPIYLLGLSWLIPSIPMASVDLRVYTESCDIADRSQVLDAPAQSCRIRHIPDELTYHTCIRDLHHQSALDHLAFREDQ